MSSQGKKKLAAAIAVASSLIMGAAVQGVLPETRVKLALFLVWALHMINTQLPALFGDVAVEKLADGAEDVAKKAGPLLLLGALLLTGCAAESNAGIVALCVLAVMAGVALAMRAGLLRLALMAAACVAVSGCATTGGHWSVVNSVSPAKYAACLANAAAAQAPCDVKPAPPASQIIACAAGALAAMTPCLPDPVWVADAPSMKMGTCPK